MDSERIKALEVKSDNLEAVFKDFMKAQTKYIEKHSEAEDAQEEKLTKHSKDLSWMKKIGAFFIALFAFKQV